MPRALNTSFDYTNRDYESFRAALIQRLREKLPQYTDLSQTDAGIVILECLAMGLDINSFYIDLIANESYLSTAQQLPNVLKWAALFNYTPRYASPARFQQVFVLVEAADEPTVIPAGTVLKTVATATEESVYFETLNDHTIPTGMLGNETDPETGDYLYTTEVVQGISVYNEIVGTSNGTANQTFMLKHAPVITSMVDLYVNDGVVVRKWTRVNSFIDSTPSSNHYTIALNTRGEATITFGDGVFGAIPASTANGITCSYRVGGGAYGNVGANKITELDNSLYYIAQTFNPDLPSELGYDMEDIETIRRNAPTALNTKWGALSLGDFGDIIKATFPWVVDAVAVKHDTNVDDINIYIMTNHYTLQATTEQKAEIQALFSEDGEGRKIVGLGIINLLNHVLHTLSLTAKLVVDDYHNQDDVKFAVTVYVTEYLRDMTSFAKEFSYSSLAGKVIANVEGVRSFMFVTETDLVTPLPGRVYALMPITWTVTGGIV